MRTDRKRKTDALAKARREEKAKLITKGEKWAPYDPEAARCLAYLRALPEPTLEALAGAAAGAADAPVAAPSVSLKTKGVKRPTRARGKVVTTTKGVQTTLPDATPGVLVREWDDLRSLFRECFPSGRAPEGEGLNAYAEWKKRTGRSFMEAKRMLYARLANPPKDNGRPVLYSGALVDLFRPKLTNGEPRFEWVDWLLERYDKPTTTVEEIANARREHEAARLPRSTRGPDRAGETGSDRTVLRPRRFSQVQRANGDLEPRQQD